MFWCRCEQYYCSTSEDTYSRRKECYNPVGIRGDSITIQRDNHDQNEEITMPDRRELSPTQPRNQTHRPRVTRTSLSWAGAEASSKPSTRTVGLILITTSVSSCAASQVWRASSPSVVHFRLLRGGICRWSVLLLEPLSACSICINYLGPDIEHILFVPILVERLKMVRSYQAERSRNKTCPG